MALDVFDAGPKAFPGYNAVPADPEVVGEVSGPLTGGPSPLPHDTPPAIADPDVAAELQLLRQIRDTGRAGASQLVVSEQAPPSITEVDYPVPGVKRWLIPREVGGGVFNLESEVWTSVIPGNRSRLGGSVVNKGATGLLIKLTSLGRATQPAHGVLWLAAKGGSWDFRLSDVVWAGSVVVFSEGGIGEVAVAEV